MFGNECNPRRNRARMAMTPMKYLLRYGWKGLKLIVKISFIAGIAYYFLMKRTKGPKSFFQEQKDRFWK